MSAWDPESELRILQRAKRTWQSQSATQAEVAAARRRYRQRSAGLSTRAKFSNFALGFCFAAVLVVAYEIGQHEAPVAHTTTPEANAPSVMAQASSAPAGAGTSSTRGQAPSETPPFSQAESSEVAQLPHATSGTSQPQRLEAAQNLAGAEQSGGAKEQSPGAEGSSQVAPLIEREGKRVAVFPGVVYKVAAGEAIYVVMGAQRTKVVGPSTLEFVLDPARASGWRVNIATVDGDDAEGGDAVDGAEAETGNKTTVPERSLQSASPATPLSSTKRVQATWQEVAQAQRRGDLVAAEAGLKRLTGSADVRTRDAAELALAQLWLSTGRKAKAQQVLTRLKTGGSTPLVRRRAAELMAR